MIYRAFKRLLDILASLILLILLSPLMLLVALLIKIESPGPVFFKQQRLGYRGLPFAMIKFRSMVTGAEKMGSGHYSFQGDPRVTRIGNIIRRTSIDELPQFINVLKGDMSMIGPRPTLTYHPYAIEDYSAADRRRFDVRPGITGWAQVNGRKELTWKKRFEYDIEYVEKLSLAFDVKIVLRTIVKLIRMENNVNVNKTV